MSGDPENLPEAEVQAELAKPELIDAYVEERKEQEADARPKDADEAELESLTQDLREKHGLDDKKKASRYERLKRARDQYKAEAEGLRAKYEQASEPRTEQASQETPFKSDQGALETNLKIAAEKHGHKFGEAYQAFMDHVQRTGDAAAYQQVMSSSDPGEELVAWFEQGGASKAPQAQDPYQAALEQGRQDVNFEAALAEREAQIRLDTEVKFRAQEFAKSFPDFYEAMESVNGADAIPAPMVEMIRRSEFGPAIAYYLAKDCWEGEGLLLQLQNLEGNPIAQAQLVGRMEQLVRNGFHSANTRQRATKAPPPIKPIQGGANAPRDLMSLAKSENVADYIRARRGHV